MISPSRYATSSTWLFSMLQHASVAFQKWLPVLSTVPAGAIIRNPAVDAAAVSCNSGAA